MATIEAVNARFEETARNRAVLAVAVQARADADVKLQAEYAGGSPLKAAVSVCAPVQLDLCAQRLNRGFSGFYQRHLIGQLKKKLYNKAASFDFNELIGLRRDEIKQLKTFWQLDDVATAPLHGFSGVDDYYAR